MIHLRVTLACLCLTAALLCGCASYPTTADLRASAAPYPGGTPVPATLDGRAGFRRTFCSLLAQQGELAVAPDCDSLLWRLADEPPASGLPAPTMPAASPRHRAFVVNGALGDCQLPGLVPFFDAVAAKSPSAMRVDTIEVSGRSGTEHNARQIATALRSAGIAADERVILIGYSKGAVDILQFLVDEPALAAQVAAVVSVAGAIEGSPLAAGTAAFYDRFLSHAFESLCPAGDGKLVDSLVPATRRQWLAVHPLPKHIGYFSLATFTTREHLSVALREPWHWLARTSTFNDGQVLASAAVIPGATLLGYVNADHWDVAIDVERSLPHLGARPSPRRFPRATLLEALLVHVDDALAATR
jgi:dienelactone hydrolase